MDFGLAEAKGSDREGEGLGMKSIPAWLVITVAFGFAMILFLLVEEPLPQALAGAIALGITIHIISLQMAGPTRDSDVCLLAYPAKRRFMPNTS
ncbi:hypothetical protein BH11ARM1_BH11ARM1_01110 [soil metagenome]